MCKSVDSVPLLSVHLAAAVTAPSWLRKLAATFSRIVDVLHADVCEPLWVCMLTPYAPALR